MQGNIKKDGSRGDMQQRKFNKDLATSKSAKYIPFWDRHYLKMFPNKSYRIYADLADDKEGKDCFVDELAIQEKLRLERDYGDVALEYKHVYDTGKVTQGWTYKLGKIDWIAYGIVPSDKVIWLEAESLAKAWAKNVSAWITIFFNPVSRSRTSNRSWRTHNVAVSTEVLIEAGVKMIITEFGGKDE